MKYPWANVLLLFLGAIELITGFLGLLWGSPDRAVVLHLHRTGGFAIIILLIWKMQNVFPPLLTRRRWKRFSVPYTAFLLGLSLLLLVLSLGLVWGQAGPFYFWEFSGVSWHIYLTLPIIPLVLWHVFFHRWSLRKTFWAERRSFLRFSGLLVAGLVLWRTGEFGAELLDLPGPRRRFTGSYPTGDFSGNAFPVTSWLNDKPPPVDAQQWRLRVRGQVERELELSYDQLAGHQERITATLDCTGGWYSTQDWQGIPLRQILEQARVKPGAASITVRSVTGYYRRFSMGEAERYILATGVGDEPLSHPHGFPLRLVAPGKRGYDWVKWVTAIELNDTSKWWQPPLPLQ